MRVRGRVRPSKPMSAIGLIIGIGFVCIGVFAAIPNVGAFGVFWTFIALAITGYHAVNLFSKNGVAEEVVDFDTSMQPDSASSREEPLEHRLARLDTLKRQGLVSDREYEEQRKRILDNI